MSCPRDVFSILDEAGMAADPAQRAAAAGRRAGGREGHRDRRPGPARLRAGRRLARRRRPRSRGHPPHGGHAPARPRRAPRARRTARAPPTQLPGMGRPRRTHRDVQRASRRVRPGDRGVGPRHGHSRTWPGSDDRPRQRHTRRAQPRGTRAAARPRRARRGAHLRRSAARRRRPRDLPPQRPRRSTSTTGCAAPSATSTQTVS